MKGTNDAWTMFINQCIVNGWLFKTKLGKEINLCITKLLIMNVNFEMLYTQNHKEHFHVITLRLYQAIHATSED